MLPPYHIQCMPASLQPCGLCEFYRKGQDRQLRSSDETLRVPPMLRLQCIPAEAADYRLTVRRNLPGKSHVQHVRKLFPLLDIAVRPPSGAPRHKILHFLSRMTATSFYIGPVLAALSYCDMLILKVAFVAVSTNE